MTNEYRKPLLLAFKYTTSRGRDTYGYNIVSLYVDGVKTTSCNGGGYDMQGTALGMYLEHTYQDRLMRISNKAYSVATQGEDEVWTRATYKDGLYGMTLMRPLKGESYIALDGGCGQSAIERIAAAAGITLTLTQTGKNQHGYFLSIN